MAEIRRLNLLNSHLNSKFPVQTYDNSLDDFRKRGQSISSHHLLNKYLGSTYEAVLKARKLMTESPLFNLIEEADFIRDQMRERVIKQLSEIYFHFNLSYERDLNEPLARSDLLVALAEYDLGLSTRLIIHLILYIDTIQNLGTEKHIEYARRAYALVDYGSFSMTEMGHGSNVAKVETRATYDKKTREFILNSPTATSAKWWIGAAAKTANMTVVFAQLNVDGVERGVHVFLVPIRNYETHEPMPGVVLGDCGKKISLEAVDNGFVIFKNYRVPYDSLLDKFSSINSDGKYKSAIKNKEKRLAVMMAGLIKGRAAVVAGSEENMRLSLTIAMRYSALRKQFGNTEGPEIPLLDYQLQKYRLIPYIAKMFAVKTSYMFLGENFIRIRSKMQEDPECLELTEHHAILSSLKALSSWYSIACTQECREATGGFGYSAYAGLGRIRANQDVHLTWEGDNSVLIQQAGKFIFKNLQKTLKGQRINSASVKFLRVDFEDPNYISKFNSSQELENEALLIEMLENRINILVNKSVLKLQENTGTSSDMIEAWNNTQVYYVQDLGKAFGEYIMARELLKFVKDLEQGCEVTALAVRKLFYLYAIGVIEKNSAAYLEDGMSANQAKIVRESILRLCNELTDVSIKIIDALAPPDGVLGSTIGAEDGQAYSRMIHAVESTPHVYDKPTWLPLVQKIRENGRKILKS